MILVQAVDGKRKLPDKRPERSDKGASSGEGERKPQERTKSSAGEFKHGKPQRHAYRPYTGRPRTP